MKLIQLCHLVTTRDLARLYQCKNGTKTINQAVKRHINRFPERFMFKLTKEEYIYILRSQFGTLELEQGQYSKYLPYAFTEQGVAMLATILRTEVAVGVSISIMDAFVLMRKYISTNNCDNRISNLEAKYIEHDTKINQIFNALESKKKINEIYFNGQIYDAYSKILSIIKESQEELIIIDNYADITILDMISKINIPVTLITTRNNYLTKIDIEKYNSQYNNLKIIYNNTFHDRYLILDNKIIYHMGSSINYAGSKTFSINKLEDKIVIISLINEIKKHLIKDA
ncbi:MAG: ORF6N domain-containing protein [Bacilli bacterium]|nr:ORF6N domain-containing protein [Bacilli bacterium]MBQ9854526.1 ORF6N domain-containing protein [Bacilli bacterium]